MNDTELVSMIVRDLGTIGAVLVLSMRYVLPMLRDYLDAQKSNLEKIADLCVTMDRRIDLLESRVVVLEGGQ